MAKTMTYEDLIRIAVETGTDGIDMTVYWLPATTDDYLLPLRRLAWKNRVEIYSIGTRVRLAQPTAELREKELAELRKWVDVAQRVGATHLRVFGGNETGRRHHGPGDRLCRRDDEARRRVPRAPAASSWAWKTTAGSPTSRRRPSRSSSARILPGRA